MKKEEEKGIKRWLKRKVSINEAVLVLFLITGGVSFAASPEVGHEHYYSEYNTNTGNQANRIIIVPYNAVNPDGGPSVTSRYNGSTMEFRGMDGIWKVAGNLSTGIGMIRGLGDGATAMGYNTSALGLDSSAYGNYSHANGSQSLALGSRANAKAGQSTAIGNDTYALGGSSIAFGNDDTSGAYNDTITQYDYDNYFKYLYNSAANGGAGVDPNGTLYGFSETGGGTVASRKYSPTVSRGRGSIAIGSRSAAFADGAVSIGTLAFSLREGATALGTKTRAEGIGSMALGNLSTVLANYSVATGNKTQVLKEGGMPTGTKLTLQEKGLWQLGEKFLPMQV